MPKDETQKLLETLTSGSDDDDPLAEDSDEIAMSCASTWMRMMQKWTRLIQNDVLKLN